jgi:hypothetical protein
MTPWPAADATDSGKAGSLVRHVTDPHLAGLLLPSPAGGPSRAQCIGWVREILASQSGWVGMAPPDLAAV